VLQASLAETERRKLRDEQDLKIKQRDQEIKVAMNAENNLTKERMKSADLSVEEVRLQKEQSETAVQLNEQTQRNLGG